MLGKMSKTGDHTDIHPLNSLLNQHLPIKHRTLSWFRLPKKGISRGRRSEISLSTLKNVKQTVSVSTTRDIKLQKALSIHQKNPNMIDKAEFKVFSGS